MLEARSGEIKLFDTGKQLKGFKQEIGYIPQKFLFERTFPLTVSELVGLGLNSKQWWYSNKGQRERIYQALEQVHLTKQAQQKSGVIGMVISGAIDLLSGPSIVLVQLFEFLVVALCRRQG